MELEEVIAQRRSIRKFETKPVEKSSNSYKDLW